MAIRSDSLPVKKLWQQINRLGEEVDQVKQQVWELVQINRRPLELLDDEGQDAELRALVGVDPPLSLSQERKRLRQIIVRRHANFLTSLWPMSQRSHQKT